MEYSSRYNNFLGRPHETRLFEFRQFWHVIDMSRCGHQIALLVYNFYVNTCSVRRDITIFWGATKYAYITVRQSPGKRAVTVATQR